MMDDRVALITGGASGIGAATAHAFVRSGATVVVTDVDDDAGKQLVADLGERSSYRHVDVRSTDAIRDAVEQTVAQYGRLDVIFNNAGAGLNAPLTDHSDDDIDRLLEVNLRAAIVTCRTAMPYLIGNESGGVIVNNASNGGVIGRAPDPVYCATKHGLVGLTKSLALAHAHQGVRVNAICPGPIDTPMLWGNFQGVPRQEAERRILATCPQPQIAAASEVAATVVFLASPEAQFINGVALPIDGAKAAGVMTGDRYRLDFPLMDRQGDAR